MSRLGQVLDGLTELFGRLSRAEASGRRGRVHAEREDGVVVFVVGMRVNAVLRIHRWLPVFLVAPRMVRQLEAEPESGLLGSWTFLDPPRGIGFVQYWDSFESLRGYARDSEFLHLDAWQKYNKQAADGAVGIWHETYRVDPGAHESVYNNVAPRGLGAADGTTLSAATGRAASAAGRLEGQADPPPVAPPETEE